MDDMRCNCPPLSDVMRGLVTGTKPPCPVHPELSPGTFLSPMNPDQAGDWYASLRPGPGLLHEACECRGGVCDCAGRPCALAGGGSMLEIAAAQIRYALESDEPSDAMRVTLTIAQNALNRVCRRCAGERWEDAEAGGRCVNCGTPHHDLDDEFGDLPPGKPCPTVPVAIHRGQPCARTTGWCDGVMCRETERDCPNAEPM